MEPTIHFDGRIMFDRPLRSEHRAYLYQFSHTRRMQRDPALLHDRADPIRQAAGLPLGPDGGYFVGDPTWLGMDVGDVSVRDANIPPQGQPGLWCAWTPTDDGEALICRDQEIGHCSPEWLQYLIQHFIEPWHYTLNGEIRWESETIGWSDAAEDFLHVVQQGHIIVQNNHLQVSLTTLDRPNT